MIRELTFSQRSYRGLRHARVQAGFAFCCAAGISRFRGNWLGGWSQTGRTRELHYLDPSVRPTASAYAQVTHSAGLGTGVPFGASELQPQFLSLAWDSSPRSRPVLAFDLGLKSPVPASPGLRCGTQVPVPAFGRHGRDPVSSVPCLPVFGPATRRGRNVDFDAKFTRD